MLNVQKKKTKSSKIQTFTFHNSFNNFGVNINIWEWISCVVCNFYLYDPLLKKKKKKCPKATIGNCTILLTTLVHTAPKSMHEFGGWICSVLSEEMLFEFTPPIGSYVSQNEKKKKKTKIKDKQKIQYVPFPKFVLIHLTVSDKTGLMDGRPTMDALAMTVALLCSNAKQN